MEWTASFFAQSAEILAACYENRDDLDLLLDPTAGFAPSLSKICKNRIEELAPSLSQEELQSLQLESNTWDLLQLLCSLRKTEPPSPPSPSSPSIPNPTLPSQHNKQGSNDNQPTADSLLLQNPYTPTSLLAQAILGHSPLLQELVVVREWLHDTAPLPVLPSGFGDGSTGAGTGGVGYNKFTLLRLQQAQRTGSRSDISSLVTELDPDAPNRLSTLAAENVYEGSETVRGPSTSSAAVPRINSSNINTTTTTAGSSQASKKKVLAADDANYEKALAQALYGYIRAGRLDEAIELCRRTKRSWRAASVRGSLLFEWRALANDQPIEENDNTNPDTAFADGWSGNKRRKLWKTTCTRAALNPHLPDPDRAIHAALAPSPATSVVLRGACKTWSDHLWAWVSIICEGKQVDELERAGAVFGPNTTYGSSGSVGISVGGGGGGGYWEGGEEAVERIGRVMMNLESAVEGGDDNDGDNASESERESRDRDTQERESRKREKEKERKEWEEREKREREREEREWVREVTKSLESLASVAVSEGPPATNPFQVSQLHIILNRTDKLLSDFAEGISRGEFHKGQASFPVLSRFFAHLCLYLRMIDMSVPADATQTILEVYLQVLEESGQREHIALYASALGENAVERYALFLSGLGLGSDGRDLHLDASGLSPTTTNGGLETTTSTGTSGFGGVGYEERKEALNRAGKRGLDVSRVARVTAERSLERAFEVLPRMKIAPLPNVVLPGCWGKEKEKEKREATNRKGKKPATNAANDEDDTMEVEVGGTKTSADEISDMEWFLIRSIEWTTFQEETFVDALEHANTVFRYFFGCGKVIAAKALLSLLPTEQLKRLSVDKINSADSTANTPAPAHTPTPQPQTRSHARLRRNSIEFMHYLQFFGILDVFAKVWDMEKGVVSVVAESATSGNASGVEFEFEGMTKGAMEDWVEKYKTLIDEVREKIVELATTDWLVNEEDLGRTRSQPQQRQIMLTRIRKIYIPELIIQLHAILVRSGKLAPKNLKYALELANIVADERYMLYGDFVCDGPEKLEGYLGDVRRAVVCALEGGGEDPFRVVSVRA